MSHQESTGIKSFDWVHYALKDLQRVLRLSLRGIFPILTFFKRLEGWVDTSSQHGLHKSSDTRCCVLSGSMKGTSQTQSYWRKKGAMLWLIMLYWDFFLLSYFFPLAASFPVWAVILSLSAWRLTTRFIPSTFVVFFQAAFWSLF